MGTNYYWHDRFCDHCGRVDVIHVCKAMYLWCAYKTVLYDPEHPEWGTEAESPFGFDVVSLDDWRRVFADRPGYIRDEYGRDHDKATFLDAIRPWRAEDEGRKYLDADIALGRGWLDDAGYRFYLGEFT